MTVRCTKQGLVIPATLLKGMGEPFSVQRQGAVLIIESQERKAARTRLRRFVRQLAAPPLMSAGSPPTTSRPKSRR